MFKQTNIIHINHLAKKLCAIVALSLALTSCKDNGCIEANDYGQYESQTITIRANGSAAQCTYDDIARGAFADEILKECLTVSTGEFNHIDSETPVEKTKGCTTFIDAELRSCQNQCLLECNERKRTSSQTSEPDWESTDERSKHMNHGVTIEPGAEISIRVKGQIQLDDKDDSYNKIVAKPNTSEASSHVYDVVSNHAANRFFDIKSGKTIKISFSGEWNDGTTTFSSGSGKSLDVNKAFDFGKRLFLQLTSHVDPYDFDYSKTSEKEGIKGVPIKIDRNTWKCDAIAEGEALSCYSDYLGNGYNNISSNDLINQIYPIIGNENALIDLGNYGGIIRSNTNDGRKPEKFDPFAKENVTCLSNTACSATNPSGLDNIYVNKQGHRIGGLDEPATKSFTNNHGYPIKVSFKTIDSDNSGCQSFNLQFKVIGQDGTTIFPRNDSFHSITINNTWQSKINDTEGHYTLEPGQQLLFNSISQKNSSNFNCGNFAFMKFGKYRDIKIHNSGFISFKKLVSTGPNCTIKGRIINPKGLYLAKSETYTPPGGVEKTVILNPDFYEYDYIQDPFVTGVTTSTGNWNGDIFVRKGQILRIDPESWDSATYNNSDDSNQCGVGVAMHIDKRPALLCYGSALQYQLNPECEVPKFKDGKIVGCDASYAKCIENSSSGTNYFCGDVRCHADIQCSDGVAPLFIRSCPASVTTPNTCPTQYQTVDANGNSTTVDAPPDQAENCNRCNSARLEQAKKAAKVEISGSACYDFEDYKGKVSNITNGDFKFEDLQNSALARGAKEVGEFNGYYGSFTNITATGDEDNDGKTILQSQPITFPQSGRIEFAFVETKQDFRNIKNSFSNNTGKAVMDFSGNKVGSKGDYLQIALCKENKDNSVYCFGPDISSGTSFDLIKFQNKEYDTTSPYKIDDDGYIYRTNLSNQNGSSGDCNQEGHGTIMTTNTKYFCHTEDYDNKGEEQHKYRLSFKIVDPENFECELGKTDNSKLNNSGNAEAMAKWNGVLSPNNSFYKEDGNNVGKICGPDEENCKKEFYCVSKYANNTGEYKITVQAKTTNTQISKMIASVIEPIIHIIDGKPGEVGQVERVYKAIISDPKYKTLVTTIMILMITFYGFGYLMGVSEFSNAEIMSRIIKIAIIYFFIGESGWYWFDRLIVDIFKDGANHLAFLMASSFDDTPEILSSISNGNYDNKAILFTSVDRVFDLIFATAVQNKIKALIFTGIFGWAYALLIYYGLFIYIFAVANAVLIYLTAQIFISILFTLGPIFLLFILFKQTQEMFDNWLKALIGFALQQIFLLTTLAFFNMLIYEVIKIVLNYSICYRPVWIIEIFDIIKITVLEYWKIGSMPQGVSQHIQAGVNDNIEDFPSLFSVLFIWIIASLMAKFIEFMTEIATSIGGGISASELSSGIKSSVSNNEMGKAMKKRFKQTFGNTIARADQVLFDSGALAKQAREKKKAQDRLDQSNKSTLKKAAQKAESKHRIANAGNPDALSEEALAKVRNDAMIAKGEKLGLSEKEVKKLREDSGLKYRGSSLGGAAIQAGSQMLKSGGTLNNSIDNTLAKESKSSLTGKEAKKAGKAKDKYINKANFSDKQKKDIENLVKEGKTEQEAKRQVYKEGVEDAINKGRVQKTAMERATDETKAGAKTTAKGLAGVTASAAINSVAGTALVASTVFTGAKGNKTILRARSALKHKFKEKTGIDSDITTSTKQIAKGGLQATLGIEAIENITGGAKNIVQGAIGTSEKAADGTTTKPSRMQRAALVAKGSGKIIGGALQGTVGSVGSRLTGVGSDNKSLQKGVDNVSKAARSVKNYSKDVAEKISDATQDSQAGLGKIARGAADIKSGKFKSGGATMLKGASQAVIGKKASKNIASGLESTAQGATNIGLGLKEIAAGTLRLSAIRSVRGAIQTAQGAGTIVKGAAQITEGAIRTTGSTLNGITNIANASSQASTRNQAISQLEDSGQISKMDRRFEFARTSEEKAAIKSKMIDINKSNKDKT